jgi:hypothetical protein
MTTLREFEEVLREWGIDSALNEFERMRESDGDKLSMGQPLTRVDDGRKMTPALALQILSLHENYKAKERKIALRLDRYRSRVSEAIRQGKGTKGNSRPPGTPAQDRTQPANGSLLPNDEDKAALHQLSELTETLEATADLLQQEISDDLRERRIALTQICETQDVIQKKIDEANEWLARRAG